jgi:hypothetical protein
MEKIKFFNFPFYGSVKVKTKGTLKEPQGSDKGTHTQHIER